MTARLVALLLLVENSSAFGIVGPMRIVLSAQNGVRAVRAPAPTAGWVEDLGAIAACANQPVIACREADSSARP